MKTILNAIFSLAKKLAPSKSWVLALAIASMTVISALIMQAAVLVDASEGFDKALTDLLQSVTALSDYENNPQEGFIADADHHARNGNNQRHITHGQGSALANYLTLSDIAPNVQRGRTEAYPNYYFVRNPLANPRANNVGDGRLDRTAGGLLHRGPVNTTRGRALAYTTHLAQQGTGEFTLNNTFTSANVWIGLEGDLRQAILDDEIASVVFTFYAGLGVLNSNTWHNNSVARAYSYAFMSLHQSSSNYTPSANAQNYIFRTPHTRIQNRRNTHSYGVTRGITPHFTQTGSAGHDNAASFGNQMYNSWELQTIAITPTNLQMQAIANNGGFFIRFTAGARTTSYGSSVRHIQSAVVFEGMSVELREAALDVDPAHHQRNRVQHVAHAQDTTLSNYLTFSNIPNATTPANRGVVANPRGASYNLRNRGPENTNQGRALAYTNFGSTSHYSNAFGGQYRDRHTSMQLWIGVDGELQERLIADQMAEVEFTFFYGLGAYATNARHSLTRTFIDLSFDRVMNTGLTRINHSHSENVTTPLSAPGDIVAGSRALVGTGSNALAGATSGTSDDPARSIGQTMGFPGGFNAWSWQETSISIPHQYFVAIGENGGFWLRLYAHSAGWSTSLAVHRWLQNAIVFEGMNMQAVLRQDPTPNMPQNLTAVYGQTLLDVALPRPANPYADYGWFWADESQSVGTVLGPNQRAAIYIPYCEIRYFRLFKMLDIAVLPRAPNYILPSGLTGYYGALLSDVILPEGWSWTSENARLVGSIGESVFEARYVPVNINEATIFRELSVYIIDILPSIQLVDRAVLGFDIVYTFEFGFRGAHLDYYHSVFINGYEMTGYVLVLNRNNLGLNVFVLRDNFDREVYVEIYLKDITPDGDRFLMLGWDEYKSIVDGVILETSFYEARNLVRVLNRDLSVFYYAWISDGMSMAALITQPVSLGFLTDGAFFEWLGEYEGDSFIFGATLIYQDIDLINVWRAASVLIEGDNFASMTFGVIPPATMLEVIVEQNQAATLNVFACDNMPSWINLAFNAVTGAVGFTAIGALVVGEFSFFVTAQNLLDGVVIYYTIREFNIIVKRAEATAPNAPLFDYSTSSMIVLRAHEGAVFSIRIDDVWSEWQQDNRFGGLNSASSYEFRKKLLQTATHNISPYSISVQFRTSGVLTGTNGGIGGAICEDLFYGLLVGECLPSPRIVPSGFDFAGWSLDGNIVYLVPNLTNNVVLEAVWEIAAFDIGIEVSVIVAGNSKFFAPYFVAYDGISYEIVWYTRASDEGEWVRGTQGWAIVVFLQDHSQYSQIRLVMIARAGDLERVAYFVRHILPRACDECGQYPSVCCDVCEGYPCVCCDECGGYECKKDCQCYNDCNRDDCECEFVKPCDGDCGCDKDCDYDDCECIVACCPIDKCDECGAYPCECVVTKPCDGDCGCEKDCDYDDCECVIACCPIDKCDECNAYPCECVVVVPCDECGHYPCECVVTKPCDGDCGCDKDCDYDDCECEKECCPIVDIPCDECGYYPCECIDTKPCDGDCGCEKDCDYDDCECIIACCPIDKCDECNAYPCECIDAKPCDGDCGCDKDCDYDDCECIVACCPIDKCDECGAYPCECVVTTPCDGDCGCDKDCDYDDCACIIECPIDTPCGKYPCECVATPPCDECGHYPCECIDTKPCDGDCGCDRDCDYDDCECSEQQPVLIVPDAPTVLQVKTIRASSIVLYQVAGAEFRIVCVSSGGWSAWQYSNIFENLTANTQFIVQKRWAATPTHTVSEAISEMVRTLGEIVIDSGNSGIELDIDQDAFYNLEKNDCLPVPSAPDGIRFLGWMDESGDIVLAAGDREQNATLTATWEIREFALDLDTTPQYDGYTKLTADWTQYDGIDYDAVRWYFRAGEAAARLRGLTNDGWVFIGHGAVLYSFSVSGQLRAVVVASVGNYLELEVYAVIDIVVLEEPCDKEECDECGNYVCECPVVVPCDECGAYPCECIDTKPCDGDCGCEKDCDYDDCECEKECCPIVDVPCDECGAYPCECVVTTPCEGDCGCDKDCDYDDCACIIECPIDTPCGKYPCECPVTTPCDECGAYPCECVDTKPCDGDCGCEKDCDYDDCECIIACCPIDKCDECNAYPCECVVTTPCDECGYYPCECIDVKPCDGDCGCDKDCEYYECECEGKEDCPIVTVPCDECECDRDCEYGDCECDKGTPVKPCDECECDKDCEYGDCECDVDAPIIDNPCGQEVCVCDDEDGCDEECDEEECDEEEEYTAAGGWWIFDFGSPRLFIIIGGGLVLIAILAVAMQRSRIKKKRLRISEDGLFLEDEEEDEALV